jgi:hypothetical protein
MAMDSDNDQPYISASCYFLLSCNNSNVNSTVQNLNKTCKKNCNNIWITSAIPEHDMWSKYTDMTMIHKHNNW